ncbi:RRP12-like protein [Asparagus officinalis]|uniref:RRP12-like protein n=1 Tax=Asparagus officinalis TaxID=4686 RepID=UPI00098DF17C|nr:RRP12-like protein [Asparagus officinalis]
MPHFWLSCSLKPVSGVKAGLKCVGSLVKVGEKGNWAQVSAVYGVVLGFVTDPRPKVRKQSHACLYDLLQSFRGSSAIVFASEGVTNLFERFLLLAGGSDSSALDAAGGPRGAMEVLTVLYILNAIKDCLPLMSIKYATNIMKYCKSLVNLRQPILTRTVMEILQSFCSSPTAEVAAEVLLYLLCTLAIYVAEKSLVADEMASTARLLHIGMKKVHSLNREICIVKLPLIFNSLGDVLTSEHEEAIFAAAEAFKGLISSCVDEGLVKQGFDQITLNAGGGIRKSGIRKSGPTIIERICSTMEGLLGYKYNAVWDMSFQVLSAAFYQLGNFSSSLMAGTVRSLANLESLPDEVLPFRKRVAGGLAGEKPHMISAAVKGLARLVYEFSDLVGAAYSLLPSSFLLLQRKNREIIKANLGLIKVLVAKSKSEGLQMHLRTMVEGLLKWQDNTKNHFKAKVKVLLEMLVRKCGVDAVRTVMPEEHMKLLTNIRKIKERKERKAKSDEDSESIHTKTSISRYEMLSMCEAQSGAQIISEIFLSILPLNVDAENISDANVWLLPILKQYTVGAHLKFFSHNILDMIKVLQQKSHKLEAEGRTFSAKSAEGLVYQLWSLLPAFCNYPVDTSTSFKDLQKVICLTLPRESELHGIMCSSLQILIGQNKSVLEEGSITLDDKLSDQERKAKEHYTQAVAEENLKAIRSSSSKMLSVLSDTFLNSSKDNGGCLQSTIREFASISDKIIVKNFFKKVMIKLLRATEKASKGKQLESSSDTQIDESSNAASLLHARALLLDLAVCLLPGVDKEEIDLLFTAIRSPLQDKEGSMQKKAYKTLATILKESDEFLSSKVDELIPLLLEATDSCHFSAKRHRLDSLYYLIVYVSKDTSEQRKTESIIAFLTEIILALKEVNRKTRNRAYDLLVEIGHACGDEDQGGKKENLFEFFKMVAGGLAGEKPHMISAAVKGLARLVYEFSDLVGAAYSLLPSSFLLLQRKNREIIKANLGLIKVLVAKSKSEGLQMHLRTMVEGLLKWQDNTKNHFKAKVKLLLEMLVRKCGVDAVRAVMPEEHMKLLTNIRKIKERKERKAKSDEDSESIHTKTSISRQSRWNHTRIFSDLGDDGMDDDSDAENAGAKTVVERHTKAASRASLRSIWKLQAAKSLPEDLLDQMEDDPLDLLDRHRTRSALQSSTRVKRKTECQDEPELDPDGRLVVKEDGSYLRKPKSHQDHDQDTRSQTGSRYSVKSSAKAQKKRQKTSESGWAYTGNEYTNKKSSGDVKKKDKLDPYAYWPLDRKLLNRRAERKASARKGMASVMKFTKKFEGKSASAALSAKGVNLKKKKRGNK